MRRSPIPPREKLKWYRENTGRETGRVSLACVWCFGKGHIEADERGVARLSSNFEWDHLAPVSRGGGNEAENLMPTCQPCNRRKRDRHPHEFAAHLAALGIQPWARWAEPPAVVQREETVEERDRYFEEQDEIEERLAREQQDEIDEELWRVAQNPRGECRLA